MIEAESLTVDEVSLMLGISRNTVYKLAKEGQLPSYRIGRKLRFSRQDIAASLAQGGAQACPECNRAVALEQSADSIAQLAEELAGMDSPRLRMGGDDILAGTLSHHLSQRGVPSIAISMSSYAALVSLFAGNVDLAVVDLYDFKTNSFNTPYVQHLCPGVPLRIVRLLKRQCGLFVKAGNPKNIKGWGGLLHADVRIAMREMGSGAQVLLDQKLVSLGANVDAVHERSVQCKTAAQAIACVAAGSADVCVGFKEEAMAFAGVQFVPAMSENLDIVVRKSTRSRKALREIQNMTSSVELREEFMRTMDCDPGQCGAIAYEC